MPTTVEKKAVVRERHEEAIIEFTNWLRRHPKASLKQQAKQFDKFIDNAFLRRQIHRGEAD
jgi:hypothetical protein